MKSQHFNAYLLILVAATLNGALAELVRSKCSLARELYFNGVSMSEIPDWLCIAREVSNYDGSKVSKLSFGGVRNYGVFQFSNEIWCRSRDRLSKNLCHVDCRNIVADEIAETVKCAKIIQRQQGLSAWQEWKDNCQLEKPNAEECFKSQQICFYENRGGNIVN